MKNVLAKRCILGLYEKALPDSLSWIQRLSIAKDAGYDFLEISIDETDKRLERLSWEKDKISDIKHSIIESSMPIWTMCLSANRRYPLGSDNNKERMKAIEIVKKAVDFSNQIGIKIIQLASYDTYYEISNERTKNFFWESLVNITEYASCNGVMLAFENMDTIFIDSITKSMKYVNLLKSPWVNVYPDIGNLVGVGYTTADIEKDMLAGEGHIASFHIKDARRNTIRNVKYGDGDVDFVHFFNILEKIGYSGLLVAEMWSDQTSESIEYIYEANQFIKDRMKQTNKNFQVR